MFFYRGGYLWFRCNMFFPPPGLGAACEQTGRQEAEAVRAQRAPVTKKGWSERIGMGSSWDFPELWCVYDVLAYEVLCY